MTRALAWIRKSKGSDDDIGLEDQRRKVHALAEDLADDVEAIDLGVQTGFTSMTRDGDGLLDQRDDVQNALERIRGGEYDYLVALDDTRVCRDGYSEVIKYACIDGDVEIAYVRDVPDDDLTHDIRRRVERSTKEDEIEKGREAVQTRLENGYDHGRPRFGMEYDDAGHYQVPGEKFDTVLKIFQLDNRGHSLREIEEETGVPYSTVSNVLDRREWYVERERMAEDAPSA